MRNAPQSGKGHGFCTQYRNRWGKLMKASDYGYKCWPFGRKQ